MASPQLENGYTRIANEILEILASTDITKNQMKLILIILRKSYGYKERKTSITNKQFILESKLNKYVVCRTINELKKRRIVVSSDNKVVSSDNKVVSSDNKNDKTYCFNKDYDTWKVLEQKSKKLSVLTTKVVSSDNKVVSSDNKVLSVLTTACAVEPILPCLDSAPKESIKESIKERKKRKKVIKKELKKLIVESHQKKFDADSEEIKIAKLLYFFILERNSGNKIPNFQQWAKQIDFMIRIDKRDIRQIKEVIEWCQNDNFWQNNILSPIKLRKHFDQLHLKMNKKRKPKYIGHLEQWYNEKMEEKKDEEK